MKRLIETRKSTLIGLLGGIMVLMASTLIAHQDIAALFNLPGLIMVLGGTLMATFVSRPVKEVIAAFRALRKLIHDDNPQIDAENEIRQLLNIAHWYRLGNIITAEQELARVHNPLLRAGAQLVLDQEPIHDVVKTLQWHIAGVRAREQSHANIMRTMATFSPAFGMLGTLFGLMQMLNTLGTAGLAEIGASMSFALLTTLYGLILANMIFKPLAMKMERHAQHQTTGMNFILEGIMLLHQRRHPMIIKEALNNYIMQLQTARETPATPLGKVA